MVEAAAESGNEQCMVYALGLPGVTFDADMCIAAARAGNGLWLRHTMGKMRTELQGRDLERVVDAAIGCDSYSCISVLPYSYARSDCERRKLAQRAARNGAVECMRHLIVGDNDLGVVRAAAQGGWPKCLALALENISIESINPKNLLDPRIPDAAVDSGSVACVRLLGEAGFRFSSYHTTNAAARGNLDMLQCLHDEVRIALGGDAAIEAARGGKFDCFDYCFPENHTLCSCPLEECLRIFAGRHPSLAHVQALMEKHRCKATAEAFCAAAECGNLEILKYLHKRSLVSATDGSATGAAARAGHMDCLQFLCEEGFTCDEHTLFLAEESGSHEIVTFVFNQCAEETRSNWPNENMWFRDEDEDENEAEHEVEHEAERTMGFMALPVLLTGLRVEDVDSDFDI
jgi:hypothetical protein